MPDVPLPAPDRAAVATALQTLDRDALASARWFGAKGRTIDVIALHEAFLLDQEGPHVLAIADLTLDDGTRDRYSLALTGTPLREAVPGDGAWRALAIAMAEGRTIAAMPRPTKPAATSTPPATPATPGPVTAALVCRPAVAMPPVEELGTERDLGADQSNTGVVIGEHVLLKAYRRLQPGLNPDL
jgi:maltokinase